MYVYHWSKQERHEDLKTELLSDYAKGVNNWPTIVDEAVQLLNTYHIKKQPWGMQMMHAEMAFAQVASGNKPKENSSRGRNINHSMIYHRCGEAGQIS